MKEYYRVNLTYTVDVSADGEDDAILQAQYEIMTGDCWPYAEAEQIAGDALDDCFHSKEE